MINLKILSLKYLLPGLLLLGSTVTIGQNQVQAHIDSLHKKLTAVKGDTNKVNLLIDMGHGFFNSPKEDSVLFYFQRALQLSNQLKWETGIARAWYSLAIEYYFRKDYAKCQAYAEQSTNQAFKIGDYQQALDGINFVSAAIIQRKNIAAAVTYLNSLEGRFAGHHRQLAGLYTLLGGSEQQRSRYPDAIDYYDKAFALEKADHCNYVRGNQLLDIAEFYRRLHFIKKAKAVLTKAAADFQKSGDQYMLAHCYYSLGLCADEDLDYVAAIANYAKIIPITEKINQVDLWGETENGIGWDYFLMKDYDKAYTHTIRAIELQKNDSAHLVYALSTLGSIYREAPESVLNKAGIKPGQQYERSVALLKEAINYRKKHGYTSGNADANLTEISLTYEKMHRYGDALIAYKTYIMQKNHADSLVDGKAVELKEAQIGYSHKEDSLRYKQNITNEQLKAKKLQIYFFIGGIGALLVLSVFIWLNYRNQRKSNKLLADANHQLGEQREEITVQRDQLSGALTNLKAAQQQLIQTEKMASLGELTAGIAHEIQNPLNFVNNFSDVNREMLEELKAESTKPKADWDEQLVIELINDLTENEQKVNHHGKRADAIVKGMLEHSRASTGQKEPTDLNKLADEYLRLAYHGLRAKDKNFNADLVTNFDENLSAVNIIPQEIGRVLLNLFNNAFYAVQQRQLAAGDEYKPAIEVTTHIKGQQMQLTVKDNGTGIPNAIKDRIMQPFFTTKPTGQGTGLGLSLSYDIVVKGHGGNIAVNSIVGEGSEFIIQIPST
jgi:two-component system, NtrC family, sensor kinase